MGSWFFCVTSFWVWQVFSLRMSRLFSKITVQRFPVVADEMPNTFPYFKGQIVIRWHWEILKSAWYCYRTPKCIAQPLRYWKMSSRLSMSTTIYNFTATDNHPLLSAMITADFQYYMSLQVFFHPSPHISFFVFDRLWAPGPENPARPFVLIFFALFGIPLNLLTLQSVGEHINYGIHLIIKYFEKVVLKKETPAHQHIKCFAINLLLITLWLPLGGIMYYYSEKKDWLDLSGLCVLLFCCFEHHRLWRLGAKWRQGTQIVLWTRHVDCAPDVPGHGPLSAVQCVHVSM